jgi:hypothetical protein
MTEAQENAIKKHGLNLLAIFPEATERDPIKLCKKLRRLEAKANAFALRLCNGPQFPGGEEEQEAITEAILSLVDDLLKFRETGPTIFLNRDPRGYALKIPDKAMSAHVVLSRDWGGYGIIAPEFSKEGS